MIRALESLHLDDDESSSVSSSEIHHLTDDPTAAWQELKKNQVVKIIKPLDLDTSKEDGFIRFVCISDTHSRTKSLKIPPGDVLLHAGDFTNFGSVTEVKSFNSFLKSLPHPIKIVIAGNHELSFDKSKGSSVFSGFESLSSKLTDCIYLQDSSTVIHGIKIYGTPWQPYHRGWAFNLRRGIQCMKAWKKIPSDTDILLSHTPPVGHGDLLSAGFRAGCVELLHEIQNRIKPKYHVFGHIHEGYGISSDGTTTFLNASICNTHFEAVNSPIIFDYPKPET